MEGPPQYNVISVQNSIGGCMIKGEIMVGEEPPISLQQLYSESNVACLEAHLLD